MNTEQQEKLNRFVAAVNDETDKQVEQILKEANDERDQILSAAKSNAEAAKERHISDNLKMEKNRCMRLVSKAEFDIKKEIILHRDRLTDELFAAVEDRIARFRATEEYFRLIVERLKNVGVTAGCTVYLSHEDMALSDRLKAAVGENVAVSEDDGIKLGGFYVVHKENATVTDMTFDCLLKEQRGLFASKNVMIG